MSVGSARRAPRWDDDVVVEPEGAWRREGAEPLSGSRDLGEGVLSQLREPLIAAAVALHRVLLGEGPHPLIAWRSRLLRDPLSRLFIQVSFAHVISRVVATVARAAWMPAAASMRCAVRMRWSAGSGTPAP